MSSSTHSNYHHRTLLSGLRGGNSSAEAPPASAVGRACPASIFGSRTREETQAAHDLLQLSRSLPPIAAPAVNFPAEKPPQILAAPKIIAPPPPPQQVIVNTPTVRAQFVAPPQAAVAGIVTATSGSHQPPLIVPERLIIQAPPTQRGCIGMVLMYLL